MGFISKMIWSAIGAKATNKMTEEQYPLPIVISRNPDAIVHGVVPKPKNKGEWIVYVSIKGRQNKLNISTRTSTITSRGYTFDVKHQREYFHWT